MGAERAQSMQSTRLIRPIADFGTYLGHALAPVRPANSRKPRISGASHDAPERIRTSDLRFRRPTLYPAELRALAADRRERWRLSRPVPPCRRSQSTVAVVLAPQAARRRGGSLVGHGARARSALALAASSSRRATRSGGLITRSLPTSLHRLRAVHDRRQRDRVDEGHAGHGRGSRPSGVALRLGQRARTARPVSASRSPRDPDDDLARAVGGDRRSRS